MIEKKEQRKIKNRCTAQTSYGRQCARESYSDGLCSIHFSLEWKKHAKKKSDKK